MSLGSSLSLSLICSLSTVNRLSVNANDGIFVMHLIRGLSASFYHFRAPECRHVPRDTPLIPMAGMTLTTVEFHSSSSNPYHEVNTFVYTCNPRPVIRVYTLGIHFIFRVLYIGKHLDSVKCHYYYNYNTLLFSVYTRPTRP